MEPQEEAIDLREVAWKVRRYGWSLVLPIVACLCAAAIYYKFTTPIYVSQVGVSVEGNEKGAPDEVDPLVGAVLERGSPRERVTVVDSKIHSRAFLSILVERLGMNTNPALLQAANDASRRMRGITPEEYAMRVSIKRLGDMISVSVGRGSLIQIMARDSDPQAAQRLAEMIGNVLVEESRQSTLERTQVSGEFHSDQVVLAEERVRKAEEALRNFQESTLRRGFSGGVVTEQNLSAARDLQLSTNDDMDQLTTRIQNARNDWRATMKGAPIPELKSQYTAAAIGQIGALETNYAIALLRSRPDNHAEVDAIQARIASARQALFEEFERLSRSLPDNYSADARTAAAGMALDQALLRTLETQRTRLASEVDTYVRSVEGSPRDEMQLQRLKQEVETSRNFLASLRNQATSSQFSQALASSTLGPRLEVVEHPLLPLVPSSPLPRRVFGVGVLLGLVISAGIVFVGERLAVVLRSTEQAEAEYGLRVIGTVSRIEGWSRPGTYLQNHWASLAVIVVLLVTGLVFAFGAVTKSHRATTSQSLGLQQ